MHFPSRPGLFLARASSSALLGVFFSSIAHPVHAAPTQVSVTPPPNASFIAGQRFDLRVEGKGTGPFSAKLSIDGVDVSFTSGTQGTSTTDGVSLPGFGGFNHRGYSHLQPGVHTIQASFSDSTGTTTLTSHFKIQGASGKRKPVRNIIILLGDGMGVAHRTAARLVRYGVTGGDPDGFLSMDSFPATGMVTTASLNSIVTDSAPGMAGYTTGTHSKNGQEGVFPANMVSPFFFPRVEYLAEFLHRTQGKSLGLVTTADVEDATPAANAVHTGDRGAGTGIVDQYLDESDASGSGRYGTGLRVLLGGGRRWFLPADQYGSSRAAASDYPHLPPDVVRGWGLPQAAAGAIDPTRNLLADFKSQGFSYVEETQALSSLASAPPPKLLGLFAYGNMNVALDKLAKRRNQLLPGAKTFAVDEYRAPNQPMLDEMTQAALAVLSKQSQKGFVLMVEGAHIDKQSHAMDAERAVNEVIEFDRAVAVAKHFAERIDPSTVVLVLSDHECSGFSIVGALNASMQSLKALPPDGSKLGPAVAPARQKAVGTYDQAGFPRYKILADGFPETMDVDGKILFGFGANGDRYEDWTTKPRPIIDSLLPSVVKAELGGRGYPKDPINRSRMEGYFIRGQAVGREQAVHTATDIPVSAYSPEAAVAQQFVGVQRNTDIFVKLARAALGGY
ncbi:MAG: alkaline phosphatase [Polyangiaceae bacterium]|nr:alkaline phosphatase [Polyangiaceae bacterium]